MQGGRRSGTWEKMKSRLRGKFVPHVLNSRNSKTYANGKEDFVSFINQLSIRNYLNPDVEGGSLCERIATPNPR